MTDSTNICDLPTNTQPNITLETTDNITKSTMQPNVSEKSHSPVQLSSTDINKIVEGIQSASTNNMTSLPTRDIPMNQNNITNDPQVQPNFVPKTNGGYIEKIQDEQSLMYKQQQRQENDYNRLDSLYDELQTPILICIIFFLFQLPIVNKKMFYLLPSLFIKDGTMSIGGYIFKTILFGSVYYVLYKMMNHISSF
jgi:hypothetical protein